MSRKQLFGAVAVAVAVAAGAAAGRPAADDQAVDDEGFIRTWLVVAPIPLADGEEAAAAVDKEQVKDEAKMAPKAGAKVKAGDKEVACKKCQAKDYFLDLHEALGDRHENAVAYMACYVVAPEAMSGVTLKIGSDDQCKVYLNGKEVFKFTEERATDKDQDEVPGLALKKGANVLVMKVVNVGGEWSACARFVDKDGQPVKGLKVQATD